MRSSQENLWAVRKVGSDFEKWGTARTRTYRYLAIDGLSYGGAMKQNLLRITDPEVGELSSLGLASQYPGSHARLRARVTRDRNRDA